MRHIKYKKNLVFILANFIEIIIVYLVYTYLVNSLTPYDLTSFGSAIQWESSMAYIAYIFSIVAIIVQFIILALKIVADRLGLEGGY